MTTTSVIPTAWAGVRAVIVVPFTTTTEVAASPRPRSGKVTLAGLRKFVPVMVTAEPPLTEPEPGAMPVTVGAGLGPSGKMQVPMAASTLGENTFTVAGWKTFVTLQPASRWQ